MSPICPVFVGWAERSEPQHLYSVTPEAQHALEEMLGRASLDPTLYLSKDSG